MDAQEKKWQAESDARTLQEAEEIRADKGRMAAAMEILDEQMQAIMKAKMACMEDEARKRFPNTY